MVESGEKGWCEMCDELQTGMREAEQEMLALLIGLGPGTVEDLDGATDYESFMIELALCELEEKGFAESDDDGALWQVTEAGRREFDRLSGSIATERLFGV